MVDKMIPDVVRDLGRAERLRSALVLTDSLLLERFAQQRDETAFEALLHRHGPLVFGVCRRLLGDVHDAEDAFQATFLILARKAGGIGQRALLGNWLYGVAYKVAARARKKSMRRRVREKNDADLAEIPNRLLPVEPDLAPLLHEELHRLPDKYRGPIVLCYLEGKTNEEAACQLNWPVGTVKGRLNRARALLRKRLARRGVALTAGLLAANTLTVKAPSALLQETFQAALSFAVGNAAVSGAASVSVLALTKGVLQTMLLSKLKLIATTVLSVTVLLGSGGLAFYCLAIEAPAKDDKPKGDKDAIQGTWKATAFEEDGKDAFDTTEGKRFREATFTITADKIVIKSGDDVLEMSYQLDPAAKPKAIDLDNQKGKTFKGVYSLDGDSLKICAPSDPEGNRPTEVATKEGSGSKLLVLKREAKDK
jgi:RNA polymerase sigma factor (sigma-70 family)